MDLIKNIKMRRSIREYVDQPISKEDIQKIVDAGRFAATARNVQPWEFVVITDSLKLTQLGQMCENGKFLAHAKACIAVFCADTKYYLEDGCAATCNIMLAATSLGIGSCWVAGDKKPYCLHITELLSVPVSLKLVSLIALGYPKNKKEFHIADKRSLKELLHWEKF